MDANTIEIIGQVLGYCASGVTLIVYLMKTPKALQLLLCLSTLLTIMSYALLGAWTGFALNVICLVRTIVYVLAIDKEFFKKPFWTPVFIVLMITMGVITWNDWTSLLPMTALVVNTIFLSLHDNQKLRYATLFCSSTIIAYNILNGAYGLIFLESFALISAIVGLIIYSPKRKKNK